MFQSPCQNYQSFQDIESSKKNAKSMKSNVVMSLPYDMDDQIDEYQVNIIHGLQAFKQFSRYIWGSRPYLEVTEFVKALEMMNYSFTEEEIKCLYQISSDSIVERMTFCDLGIWQKRNEHQKMSIAKSISNQEFFKSQKSVLTAHEIQSKGGQSRMSDVMSKSRSIKRNTCDQMTKNFLKTGYTIQMSKDCKLQALRTDMQMNALEKKWQFIVMAGQMNKWIQQSYSQESEKEHMPQFKVISEETNFSIIRKQRQAEQLVPEVVFVKRYKAMKKKKEAKKTNGREVDNVLIAIVNNTKSQASSINQRDRQLNQALLHIMRMKNTLEHQYKILTESAINT